MKLFKENLHFLSLAGKSGNSWKIKLLEYSFFSEVVLQKKIPQYNKQDEKQEAIFLDAGWKQNHYRKYVNVMQVKRVMGESVIWNKKTIFLYEKLNSVWDCWFL